ncbi:ABC transporter ATP-binding protein [Streptosporangium sp. NPDC049644]|uniref:ABC transporter ATP-binding protein n=1 Tax=Streptosporangium sp. NPDC049644 TaxID=3155507 RepID=UPI00343B6977
MATGTWAPLTLTLMVTVAGSVTALALPAVLAGTVDAVVAGRNTLPATRNLALLLVGMTLLDIASVVAGAACVASAVVSLRMRLVGRLLAASAVEAARFPTGELVNRLVSNTATTAYVPVTLLRTAVGVITSAGGVVALFTIDWRVGTAFLAGVPLTLVVIRLLFTRMSGLYDDYQAAQGRLATRLTETLAGIRTVRAAGTVDREISRVLDPLPELSAAGQALWKVQSRSVWQLALMLPLIEVFVLGVAGFGVAEGRLEPGALLAAAGYTTLALAFVGQIESLMDVAYGRSAAQRVCQVLALPVLAPGSVPLAAGPGTLSFRGVTVTREGGPLLDGIDLEIPAGAMTAVVGPSGAGKTTLALLAGRLADPDRGQVLLDGQILGEVDPASLRSAVAYAFERPALLGGDIASAIAYGNATSGIEEVRAAASAAHVDDVIRRLPAGYRTPAAEAPLSGGEIQRLGLARALLPRARLTILDDATSSLDTATEAQVTSALVEGMRGRTRLVIAHRPATAARADLVVWLEAGRIRAQGTHRELWRDPAYRALFASEPAALAGRDRSPITVPAATRPDHAVQNQEESCPATP